MVSTASLSLFDAFTTRRLDRFRDETLRQPLIALPLVSIFFFGRQNLRLWSTARNLFNDSSSR